MHKRLQEIVRQLMKKGGCAFIEWNGEADHLHLLIATKPDVPLSKRVNNVKTVSSRMIRKEFGAQLSRVYTQPVLWSRRYCLVSCGGAPLTVIKQYMEQQGQKKD